MHFLWFNSPPRLEILLVDKRKFIALRLVSMVKDEESFQDYQKKKKQNNKEKTIAAILPWSSHILLRLENNIETNLVFDCMYAVSKSNLKHNQHRIRQLFAQHGPLECPAEFRNKIR